ncbi:hypothetical protein F4678DRAFT_460161 [Xylaria arbuscula]|nr:hypothetical protein F4678DRAFT_460161 [Xylaria arbuscula]
MSGNTSNKKFDQGASEAMPNTEFSSGIYESPQNTGSNMGAESAQGLGKTPGKENEAKPDESITKQVSDKIKDTAGAGAMVL